jgi:hypothetical protein
MGSEAIFVCHDCQVSEDSSCSFPKSLERSQLFFIKLKEAIHGEHSGFFGDMREWMSIHSNHDAVICTNAYGTYSSCDYDFETREFSNYDPYR